MNPDPDDELRALRRRAYGVDADIAGDPAALRRLNELEEHARRRLTDPVQPGAGIPADPDPGTPAEPDPGALAEPDPRAPEQTPDSGIRSSVSSATVESDAAPEPADERAGSPVDVAAERADDPAPRAPAGTPWWRRRSTLLWSAAVIVALAAGAAVTLWAVQQQGRVAVLQQADVDDWPRNVVGEPPEGSRLFEDFLGLTVVIMPQSFGGGDETDCLYVLETGGQGFMSTIGCSAGAFPATAALAVTARAPDELRERFADGTALQFVLAGSQVHVYADEP